MRPKSTNFVNSFIPVPSFIDIIHHVMEILTLSKASRFINMNVLVFLIKDVSKKYYIDVYCKIILIQIELPLAT